MADLESRFEEAEKLNINGSFKKSVKILLDIVKRTKPSDEIYIMSAGLLLGTLKYGLDKVDQDYLTRDMIDAIFEPYLAYEELQHLLPKNIPQDIRNPPGVLEFIINQNKLGHYNYQLATLRGKKHIKYANIAEQHHRTSIETIKEYKHKMDIGPGMSLDPTLCAEYNNLGNTLVEKARFYSDKGTEEGIIFKCSAIVTEAKECFIMALEDNPIYNRPILRSDKKELEEMRSDVRENIKHVQKLIDDPVRFTDIFF